MAAMSAHAILERVDVGDDQKNELLRSGWRRREADLSSFLTERNVETLRKEFERKAEGLTLAEFVYVMEKCMVSQPGGGGSRCWGLPIVLT
jgi:hypothetical protein